MCLIMWFCGKKRKQYRVGPNLHLNTCRNFISGYFRLTQTALFLWRNKKFSCYCTNVWNIWRTKILLHLFDFWLSVWLKHTFSCFIYQKGKRNPFIYRMHHSNQPGFYLNNISYLSARLALPTGFFMFPISHIFTFPADQFSSWHMNPSPGGNWLPPLPLVCNFNIYMHFTFSWFSPHI